MTPNPFPESYLSPLQTAVGNAWPRPRVRRIMEDLENVQKRMAENQMKRAGIKMTPKNLQEQRWKEFMREYQMLENELQRLLDLFKKYPATKEQFKDPRLELSDCCDQYVREEYGDEGSPIKYKCKDCGNFCRTYIRIERENWALEYQQAMADRKVENDAQLKDQEHIERMKNLTDKPQNPLKGGYLIS